MPDDPYRGLWAELRARRHAAAPAPDDAPLGQAAFDRGWITAEQLEAARREEAGLRAAGDPAPLGQILVRHRWLNPDQLAELLRAPPESAASVPQRLGRYEIHSELGRGGMGLVYRAFDPHLKRAVALKVLEGLGDPERLHREAQAAARLSHPNIVSVYDVGVETGRPYLAMELLEGQELEEAWKEWPLKRRVEAIEQVARAIDHAHRHGVVHRDLKPGNVMVTREGEVKVMDLGLARVEGESKLTLTGTVMGTPAYMAPEQVRGERAGPPADVWSLGVMLYEALTECLPFLGREAHEIYVKVLMEEPVRPRRLVPRAPVELEVVCLKAMEKEVGRRYATAEEVAEDLRRWRQGEPIRARPASTIYRLRQRIRRNPWAWGGGAAACLAALAALGITLAVRAAAGSKEEREDARRGVLAEAQDTLERLRARLRVWDEDIPSIRAALRDIVARLDALGAEWPDDADVYLYRARARSLLRELDPAVRDLDRCLELRPADARARLDRALIRTWVVSDALLLSINVIHGASRIADQQMLLPLVQSDLEAAAAAGLVGERDAALARAWLAFLGQDYATAELRATEQIERGGLVEGFHAIRALCRHLAGDPRGAADELDRAIQLDGGFVEALSVRAWLRYRSGDLRSAREDYDHLLALDESDPNAWTNRAVIRYSLSDAEGALADLARVESMSPTDPWIPANRGMIRLEQGRLADAEADFARALALDPEFARAYYGRGRVHLAAGRYAEAVRDLERARELDPGLQSTVEPWLRDALDRAGEEF